MECESGEGRDIPVERDSQVGTEYGPSKTCRYGGTVVANRMCLEKS